MAFHGILSETYPMNIKHIGYLLITIGLLGVCHAAKPNFIIIMADDMGYGDASCYGGDIQTPHLDRMAREGMKFTDFHSSGNVCSPTRAGLLTGRYQHRAGIPGVIFADPKMAAYYHGLNPDVEVTFSKLLKETGYSTAICGKWHLGYTKNFNPVHHKFDRFNGFVSGNIDFHSHYDRMEVFDWWENLELKKEKGYSTHLITKHALDFIEKSKDTPFCLYVAHEAVHSPWQGPNDPPQRGPNKKPGIKFADRGRAFAEMLVEMDRGVGQILDKLVELKLEKNTFVFFLSDNGPAGGSAGPLRGRKGSNWEGGHRVPALAWWPGTIPAGKTTDQLAISLDLMPTMLSMANMKGPDGHAFDGIDLTQLLKEEKVLAERSLFWYGTNPNSMMAMRHGDWKLMLGVEGKEKGFIGLYNLAEDLGEKNNLANQHAARVADMKKALEAWHKEVSMDSTPQRRHASPAP